MTKKIIVTGANGQLGNELRTISQQNAEFRFIFTDKEELDICDPAQIVAFFNKEKPDYCINCAAYTAVDRAESDSEFAYALNADAVGYLAAACKENGTRLLHISTDYVYHGSNNRPLIETDITQPKSVYAQSKLIGEQRAIQICEDACIVRTSWVYSEFGQNFVKTMLRLGRERDQLSVVFDQIGTPTYALHLAKALLSMIAAIENEKVAASAWSGIYHYSNEGVCSWYDFAKAIFEETGISCEVQPIRSEDYPTAAARPFYSVLDKQKIKETFSIQIPHWREGLRTCLDLMA